MASTTYAKGEIPLRNLSSSSKTKQYTPSITTTTTTTHAPSTLAPSVSTTRTLLPPTAPFFPTHTLQIQTQGKSLLAPPSPLKDLSIPIFSPTTSRPVYLSIRGKRSSGNCKLVDAESEVERVVSTTTYFWGPGRNAIVRVFRDGKRGEAEEFEIIGKGLVSRTVEFKCQWGRFEWRYAERKERREGFNSLLVLERISGDGRRARVAQLVRGEGSRTPGTRGSSAGNGGRLEMCLNGEKNGDGVEDGEGGEEGRIVDEVTVVSTCLVMLKREVDRRRAMQIAIIAAVVSGAH